MIGQDKIQDLERYISGFPWENYQREFRKPKELRLLYWSVVFLDYLDSTYHNFTDSQYRAFSDRVQKSFMGTFYRPHEIIVKWESKLNGFSKLYLSENQEVWDSWVSTKRSDFTTHFALLSERIHRFLKHQKSMQQYKTGFDLKLTEFDGKHKNIEQVISRVLSGHIIQTRYAYQHRAESLQNFPIHVSQEIIDQIHMDAHHYFAARFTHRFLINFASRLTVDRPYSTIKEDSIQVAFESLLKRYPRFSELGRAPLTEMVALYCQDKSGNKFERASIRAFLRRNGYE